MAIDNINNNPPVNVASLASEQNAVSFANSLPKEALFSNSFQPLFQSVDPSQNYQFSPFPLPFSKSDLLQKFTADPSLLTSNLQNAQGGLESIVQGLDVGGADAAIAGHMQAAQDAFAQGNMLQAQQELLEAQKLQTFISQLLNMIAQMEMDAIKNSKIQ